MFVVHASWLGPSTSRLGGLGVWGEDSSAPLTSPRRPGRAPRVQPHPYAASHADLVALLPPVGGKAAPETATLTLPTRGGGPVASPELVRDEITEVQGDLRAGLWQVPTLELEADLALDLLRGLDDEGGTYGASVVHLIELAGFAADLVTRGRLLPTVLPDPPRAVWRPVLTGPDAAWTRVLASEMPLPLAAANPGEEGRVAGRRHHRFRSRNHARGVRLSGPAATTTRRRPLRWGACSPRASTGSPRRSSTRCRPSRSGPGRSTSARGSPTRTGRRACSRRRRRRSTRGTTSTPPASAYRRCGRRSPATSSGTTGSTSTPTARSWSRPVAPRRSPPRCSGWSTRATRWSCWSRTTTPTSR